MNQANVEEVNKLVMSIGQTMKHMIQLNCPVVSMLQQLNLETGLPACADEPHWHRVLSILDLTDQQKTDAVAMFCLYCDLMVKVRRWHGWWLRI